MVDITPKSDEDEPKKALDTPAPTAANEEPQITEEALEEAEHFAAMKEKYSLPVESNQKKKKQLKISAPILLVLGVLVLVGVGAIVLLSRHSDPVDEAPEIIPVERIEDMSISLTLVEGAAEVSNSETEIAEATFSELTKASRLREGQYIRTGDNGRLIFSLGDGSAIRLDSTTTIKFEKLVENDVQLTVLQGRMYTRVTSNPARNFQVLTTADSFKSIGTAYLTQVSEQAESVLVFEGSVRTKDSQNIAEGEMLNYSLTDGSLNKDEVSELTLADVTSDAFILWNRDQDLAIEAFEEKLGFLEDLDAPKLTVTTPEENLETDQESILVSGTTDPDANLKINDIVVKVDSEGLFNYTLPLNIGKNTAVLVATDPAGNKTKVEQTITRTSEEVAEDDVSPITLVGETGTNGIDLAWTVLNDTPTTGLFKVVYNTSGTPEYKQDASQTTDDEGTVIPKKDGKTYKVRVCIFDQDEDTCTDYSNEISVKAPSS